MVTETRRRLALVGLGPNARHNYYPMLEQLRDEYGLELVALVDVESARGDVLAYTEGRTLKPLNYLFCLDEHARGRSIPGSVATALDDLRLAHGLDGLIISSHPCSHHMYLKWAASRSVDVLTDKPITAHTLHGDIASAKQLLRDYGDLVRDFAASRASVTVMVTRRSHPGYRFVRDYLADFIDQFGVPITFIETYYAGGYWNMPDEFFQRENHPYKYGFGALLHAGYHVVDLCCWLLGVNALVDESRRPDRLELSTMHVTPADFFIQVNSPAYAKLFGDSKIRRWMEGRRKRQAAHFGETDVCMLFQLLHGHRVLTTGSIKMLETAFSLRSWRDLPRDTYKGNGRVTHERVTVQMGHLLNVQTHDYRVSADSSQPSGAPADFIVRIYRNNRTVGGPRFQELVFKPRDRDRPQGDPPSLSADGRDQILRAWLERRPTGSGLEEHQLTMESVSGAYRSMARQRMGRPPVVSIRQGMGKANGRRFIV